MLPLLCPLVRLCIGLSTLIVLLSVSLLSVWPHVSAGSSQPDLEVESVQLQPGDPALEIPVEVSLTVRNVGGDCTSPCFFTVDFYKHRTSAPGPQDYGEMFCALDIPPAGMTTTCTDNLTYSMAGNQQAWAQADSDEFISEANETNNVLGPIQLQVLEDWDSDGIDNTADNCPYYSNASQSLPSWPVPSEDYDCDGWSGANETYFGTDQSVACGFAGGGNSASENWPPDLVESNSITILDVLALKPVFNSTVPPTSARFDLRPGSGITILDVLAIKPVFSKSCTP